MPQATGLPSHHTNLDPHMAKWSLVGVTWGGGKGWLSCGGAQCPKGLAPVTLPEFAPCY